SGLLWGSERFPALLDLCAIRAFRQETTMPHLLDVPGMSRWIQRDGTENVLTRMVQILEEDLRRWDSFEKIPRVASHTPYGVVELMPITDGELYAFKYVNGHPLNPARGLQTVTAFGVLADMDNGYPFFFAEMTLLTAVRTAAQSALAARELARAGSRVHALLGAGSRPSSRPSPSGRCWGSISCRSSTWTRPRWRRCGATSSRWGSRCSWRNRSTRPSRART